VPRRPLLFAAAVLALAAPLAVTDGLTPGRVEAFEQPVAAPPQVPSAYAAARRRGQPVAVLTRVTVLRATPGGRRIAKLRTRTEFGTPTVLAALGERDGWLRVMATQLPNGRTGWIAASAAGIVASPWSLRADLSKRLVTVLRGGRVARRFPVAIGKPSTPTPTGRFAITDKLHFDTRSPAYGCCAIALTGRQRHLPSGWRGGLRLAIHGTGAPDSIGQAASAGCLRAHDADVRWLVRHAYLGSIVEITR
jgi:lipoprotein-anchoring transpeptidase ErfK/SrfK